jgi:hypothetical protein
MRKNEKNRTGMLNIPAIYDEGTEATKFCSEY